jgi:hypothetical protein
MTGEMEALRAELNRITHEGKTEKERAEERVAAEREAAAREAK